MRSFLIIMLCFTILGIAIVAFRVEQQHKANAQIEPYMPDSDITFEDEPQVITIVPDEDWNFTYEESPNLTEINETRPNYPYSNIITKDE